MSKNVKKNVENVVLILKLLELLKNLIHRPIPSMHRQCLEIQRNVEVSKNIEKCSPKNLLN